MKTEIKIKSPGRINLIGEHIDYNGGHVLPAAIDLNIQFHLKRNFTNICNIESTGFGKFSFNINELKIESNQWKNYILGVANEIKKLNKYLEGFDCKIESNIPSGAGISSSAALECGLAIGLNELFNLNIDKIDIAKICRSAEHNFVGTKCGIMDQFSVIFGIKNKLLFLNCKTLKSRLVNAVFEPYSIILLNTNVSHNLAESEYNSRRNDCNKLLNIVNSKGFRFNDICEIPMDLLISLKNEFDIKLFEKAEYVILENKRTISAAKHIENNDLIRFGRLMYESHEGLRKKYKVSCKELDFLVDLFKNDCYVIGSRMMGGGFGGSTINLVKRDYVKSFIDIAKKEYYNKFNIKLTSIPTSISNGVEIL